MEDEKDRAKNQAKLQVEGICGMMKALKIAQEKGGGNGYEAIYEGDIVDEEGMEEIIQQNALSVRIRSDWQVPGYLLTPTKFEILLCTGGPAVRIIGDLGEYNEPESPQVQYQDWFTPWMDYRDITDRQAKLILEYCRMHYFDGAQGGRNDSI